MRRTGNADEKVDFVLLWVDGNDPEWLALKEQYEQYTDGDARINRYRDWDNLQYWFRGVEKYASWVNRIYFITWGHVPRWLNTKHHKIEIVKHDDYIPEKYLPSFNSRPIELNIHRIKSLSERFVLFNDDTFIINAMSSSDFFKQGFPCDCAIIMPNISTIRNSTAAIVANNMEIINTTFNKNNVVKKDFPKWFSFKYKKHLFSTFCCMPYKKFAGFFGPHLPIPYLKQTFYDVWAKEGDLLDESCRYKFRSKQGINHWLFRYWQLVTGNFTPGSASLGSCYSITNTNSDIVRAITEQKHKLICINDNAVEQVIDFEMEKDIIKQAFNTVFPEKSKFEL